MSVILNLPRKKIGKAVGSLISGLVFAAGSGVLSGINFYISAIALLISLISFAVSFTSFKRLTVITDLAKSLASLPDNFYCINNVKINSSNIDYVMICPKGIFTLERNSFNIAISNTLQTGTEKYMPIKRSILNSKALNDFMQNNKIGNYFVNTVLVSDFEDDKLKAYFPDIPILKPRDISAYFESMEGKYSNAQCKRIADLLELNLRIDKNLKQLREEKITNVKQGRKTKSNS